MGHLAGRRGVIVGYSGQGSVAHHLALQLRAQGAELALTSRPERVGELQTDSRPLEVAHHLSLDALSESSIKQAFTDLAASWTTVDFLVHTLVHVPEGVLAKPLTDLSHDDFALSMHAGVYSLVACARHARTLLAGSDSGRVVSLSSDLSHKVAPNYHLAGIGKAALEATVRYLAKELGSEGVLCNTLRFSALPTEGAARAIGAEMIEKTRTYLAKRSLTKEQVEYADVGVACAWLCSSQLRNYTGQVMSIDGGFGLNYV